MEDLMNILNNGDELTDDQLKKYAGGNALPQEQHMIEQQMSGSSFVNDAVEGLQAISSKDKLDEYVHELNKNLQKQLDDKKQKNEKRKIKDMQWIIIAVVIILLLCVLSYVVIKMQREKEIQLHQNSIQTKLYRLDKSSGENFVV